MSKFAFKSALLYVAADVIVKMAGRRGVVLPTVVASPILVLVMITVVVETAVTMAGVVEVAIVVVVVLMLPLVAVVMVVDVVLVEVEVEVHVLQRIGHSSRTLSPTMARLHNTASIPQLTGSLTPLHTEAAVPTVVAVWVVVCIIDSVVAPPSVSASSSASTRSPDPCTSEPSLVTSMVAVVIVAGAGVSVLMDVDSGGGRVVVGMFVGRMESRLVVLVLVLVLVLVMQSLLSTKYTYPYVLTSWSGSSDSMAAKESEHFPLSDW
jgi:hypothetical protein